MKCPKCSAPMFYDCCSKCWLERMKKKISDLNEMFSPDQMAVRGTCEVCSMRGFLFTRALVKPNTSIEENYDASDALPVVQMCLTCFATPPGCVSENAAHKRLPEEEYK